MTISRADLAIFKPEQLGNSDDAVVNAQNPRNIR